MDQLYGAGTAFDKIMPIPERIRIIYMDDNSFIKRGNKDLKWCLWPRKCSITKRWLWLTLAYRVENMWTGPGEPVFEYRWYERNEFLIQRIKLGT